MFLIIHVLFIRIITRIVLESLLKKLQMVDGTLADA